LDKGIDLMIVGVMMAGQLSTQITHKINRPMARIQALQSCYAPSTHEREVLALLAFTTEPTGVRAF
jgi:hypothetical protein